MKRSLLALSLLAALPFAATAAEGVSYNYVQGGYVATNGDGNADVDFIKGMIPHHQGAIDMAKVVLEKGKDPEIKKLAEGIVKAQESEIKLMNDWLKAHKK